MKILLFGGFAGIVLLQGCTMISSMDSDPIESVTEEVTYVSRGDVTAQERFRETLNLSQRGFSGPARIELVQYIKEKPGNAVAAFSEDEDKSSQAAVKKVNVAPERSKTGDEIGDKIAAEIDEPQYIVLPRRRTELGSDMEPEPAMDSEELEVMESSSEMVPAELDEETEPAISQEVEQLHREALDAYRAHKLDLAIELWGQVLVYDEDHENARLYRAQAIGLKNKLRDLQ